MTLELILLTESFSTKAALELMDFVMQYLNMLLEIGVTVESGCTELASIAVLVTLRIMLNGKEGISQNIVVSNNLSLT